MEPMMLAGTLLGALLVLLFLGGLGWLEHKKEARRRELAHVERMKAIECGYPLPDEDSARYKAIGWVGAVGPAGSLAAAAWATQMILSRGDADAPRWLVAVIWGVCGLVGAGTGLAAILRLRPPAAIAPDGDGARLAESAPSTSRSGA